MVATKGNKRIAVNTLWLYGRKGLTMLIALYSSRVLLQYLGVDDFGLYGLVGSIVLIFNSLRTMFASSIQRFMNVQREGDTEREHRIFCVGMSVHILLAVLFAVVVEIGGMLLLPGLNIAPERLSAAQWVLQFSILSAMLSILTVPYDAVLMAYERFDAYALFSIIDSVLRLGVIFLIAVSPIDKVVFYAMLLFGVALAVRLMNGIYCRMQFPEVARYHHVRDRALFKEMTQFAGWNFFGNLGYSLTNEGVNLILNSFGGLVANAARAIAAQVNNTLGTFTRDVNTTFVPQSMKAYTEGNKDRFYSLQFLSAKGAFIVMMTIGLPLELFTPQILGLWLADVPSHSVNFVRALMGYMLVRSLHSPLDTAFKSANRMKHYQLTELSIMLLNLPASWFLLYMGMPLYTVFVSMAFIELTNLIVVSGVARRIIDFRMWGFVKELLLPAIVAVAIGGGIMMLPLHIGKSWYAVIMSVAAAAVVGFVISSAVMLTSKDRTGFLKTIRG